MFYTRSSFVGQTTKDGKRMHGRGIYTMADGSKYVGTFHDGTFHGHGIIFFTPSNGGGQFRGTWNLGECLGGDYIYRDGLEFSNDEWSYTTEDDRRLWNEYLSFIQPVAKSGNKGAGADGVIVPDYSTTDGIPPSLANGKPQKVEDVSDDFWATAPLPKPEHEGIAQIVGTSEDMANLIAATREGGPVTRPLNQKPAVSNRGWAKDAEKAATVVKKSPTVSSINEKSFSGDANSNVAPLIPRPPSAPRSVESSPSRNEGGRGADVAGNYDAGGGEEAEYGEGQDEQYDEGAEEHFDEHEYHQTRQYNADGGEEEYEGYTDGENGEEAAYDENEENHGEEGGNYLEGEEILNEDEEQ